MWWLYSERYCELLKAEQGAEMPMLREYHCERCLSRFTLKDIELSGSIVCTPCLQGGMDELTAKVQNAHWRAFLEKERDALAAVTSPECAAAVFAHDFAALS